MSRSLCLGKGAARRSARRAAEAPDYSGSPVTSQNAAGRVTAQALTANAGAAGASVRADIAALDDLLAVHLRMVA